jgi:hypothetical protein
MTYVQLIVATSQGWLLFGDKPDVIAMLGAAIIVSAGLYLWQATPKRERAKPSGKMMRVQDLWLASRAPAGQHPLPIKKNPFPPGEGAQTCQKALPGARTVCSPPSYNCA